MLIQSIIYAIFKVVIVLAALVFLTLMSRPVSPTDATLGAPTPNHWLCEVLSVRIL